MKAPQCVQGKSTWN